MTFKTKLQNRIMRVITAAILTVALLVTGFPMSVIDKNTGGAADVYAASGTKTITVTKTWVNDDTSVRPDNLRVHVKQKKSLLLSGSKNSNPNISPIESKIKQIAGNGSVNADNTNIKAIKYATDAQYEAVRSSLTSANEIQESGEKTYMWFDPSSGTMYMYSDAGVIYLNTNSGGMFRKMKALEDISGLSHLDTSYVQDMNRMFQNSTKIANFSPISAWDVSYVRNFRFAFGSAAEPIGSETFVASSLEPFRNWDVSNAEDMNQMFKVWKNITTLEPIAKWDVSRVTNFEWMFTYAQGLTDATRDHIKGWDVRAGTTFEGMFNNSTDTVTKPVFTQRPGSWEGGSVVDYNTSISAVTPQPHTTPPAIDLSAAEYSDNGSGSGTGANVGDCVVTKNGNVWVYEFTVPDNDGRWTVWEDTNNGKIDDKKGLADAYTESSSDTEGLGGSEANAIKDVTDSASITNTNTKRKEITFKKTWNDNNNALGRRPSDLDISLYLNGSLVDKSGNDPGKWEKSGSTWTYKFVHYSDDPVTDYSVKEEKVPFAYSCASIERQVTRTSDQGASLQTGTAAITNTLGTGFIEMRQETIGNQGDKTKPFTITIKLSKAYPNRTFQIVKLQGTPAGDTSFTTDSSGSGSATVKLKDTDRVRINGLPLGTEYVIEEQLEGYIGTGTKVYTTSDPSQGHPIRFLHEDGVYVRIIDEGNYLGLDSNTTIVFKSEKTGSIPTGVAAGSKPWIAMLAIAAALAVILIAWVLRIRRKQAGPDQSTS